VARIVLEAQPDAVVLAGWMHVLSEAFLSLLAGTRSLPGLHTSAHPIPVINLHPALPGAFDGVDAIARAHTAFEEGKVDRTGVMVHRVVAAVDAGAPVLVREVPIVKGEPLGALEKRVHEAEWAVIVEATGIVLDEAEQVEKTT
jgi:phosphoribosylglycinamide formyltransferase